MWVKVAEEKNLGSTLGVEIKGHSYALFRLEEGVFALDDICSHEYSKLSEGEVWDGDVYCPLHGSRFDIRTGKAKSLPAYEPVGAYPVKIEKGWIYIDIDEGKL